LHLDVAERFGEFRAWSRQKRKPGAARQAMQTSSGNGHFATSDRHPPLHDPVAALHAEGRSIESIELALEDRCRIRPPVGGVLLQHRMAELAIGHARILGELGEQGEGEEAEALRVFRTLRQRHFGCRLHRARGEERDHAALLHGSGRGSGLFALR